MNDQKCQQEYIRRIHKVQDYIENHIGQSMSLEELSNAAGFSKYHFSRIFQGIIHEPLAHYVNRIRMENALFLLAHRSDKNMTDVAYELGFTDSAVFSRAFHNYFGITPREYRAEYSKNCKDSFRLSEYNKNTAVEKSEDWKALLNPSITIENMEEKQIVYVRHTGTYETLAKEYPGLVEQLFRGAVQQNLFVEGESWVLAMYHDNPEFGEEEQFRTSLCLTVPNGKIIQEDDVLGKMKLEGGLYAVGHFQIHRGQYGDAWDYMYQEWVMSSGYVPKNDCPFEVYRKIPQGDPNGLHEIDIYIPIEPIHF